MKITLSILALLASPLTFAGPESVRDCTQPSNGILPDSMPWQPSEAKQNACDQTIINSAQQIPSTADSANKVIAFKDGKLVGVRDSSLRISKPILFNASAWDETYSTKPIGELWWGRADNRHVLVGQESFLRLGKGTFSALTPTEIAQCSAEGLRRLKALKNKQPLPAYLPNFSDSLGLFHRRTLDYTQIGSTAAIPVGGSGGLAGQPSTLPPGTFRNAKLTLDTSPALKGTLSIDLSIDGANRTFTFPITNNVRRADNKICLLPEEKYRLRGATIVNGELYRCNERPAAGKLYASIGCEFADIPFKEDYDAYGAFFDDHATLVAIQVRLTVNIPSLNRHGVVVTGIVVLQAQT